MANQDTCRKTIKQMDCGDLTPSQAVTVYPAFDVCLPFGRSLSWDGHGLRLRGSVKIADGVYGLLTVENGCITDAQEQPVCDYTPAPCTPAASPCSDSGGIVTLQPGTTNLLTFDAAGRLGAILHYSAASPVKVTGSGTTSDPLVFSFEESEAEQTYVQQGDGPVAVAGNGSATAPYTVSHSESAVTAGSYGNFQLDDYGHIVGYNGDGGSISSIIDSGGLSLKTEGTIAYLGLPTQESAGNYDFGGFSARVDLYGRITRLTQSINIQQAATGDFSFDPTQYDITVNTYGNITALTQKDYPAAASFCELFSGSRQATSFTFTTRHTGYFKITYEGNLGNGTASMNWVALSNAYGIYVNDRKIAAYAKSSTMTTVSGGTPTLSTALTHVLALTDGYYAAGSHTVELRKTDGSNFTDTGVLTVTLVERG